MNRQLKTALSNFIICANEAPEGAHNGAKVINDEITGACDFLMTNMRAIGLKANNCDLIFNLQAEMYDYVKRSNPENTLFSQAENFGASVEAKCESV